MEIYSNVYQYLKQNRMEGLLGLKKSGVYLWTDKLDANGPLGKVLSAGMLGSEDKAVKEKLAKIRAKLRSGARLTGEEKNFLQTHDPQLYRKITALEKEEAAYEERLKKCSTRDEAERAKTEKLGQIAADLKQEDPEFSMLRLTRMQDVEKKTAIAVSRKPWQRELNQKKLEERRRIRKKKEEKARQERARKKRREEAIRKEKIEEELRQEKIWKEELMADRIEEENVKADIEEQMLMEQQEAEDLETEWRIGREIVEDQIAKFMIAAGMMDLQATRLQVSDSQENLEETVVLPPSLGSSTGYAAYRAAACMPEFEAQKEEEKKLRVRRA